ncbi:MAG: HEAT repeat domain-containing protein [Pseudomonadota bacterium]
MVEKSQKKKVTDIRGAPLTGPSITKTTEKPAKIQDKATGIVETPREKSVMEFYPAANKNEHLRYVRMIFDLITKAAKNIVMFQKGHQNTVKFVEQTSATMIDYLRVFNELTVTIKPFEFLYNNEVIYTNQELETSLSYKFFKDGVRNISFANGISHNEVASFLDVLTTDFGSLEMADEDMITLMWSKRFENVSYKIIESFHELSADEDIIDPNEFSSLLQDLQSKQSTNKDAKNKQGKSSGDAKAAKKQRLTRVLQHYDLSDFQEIMNSEASDSFANDLLNLDSKDLRKIDLLGKVRNTKLLQRFVQILLIFISEVKEGEEFNEAIELLTYLIGYLIDNKKYTWVINVLFQLREISNIKVFKIVDQDKEKSKKDEEKQSETITLLTSAVHGAITLKRIERIVDDINNGIIDDDQDAYRLILLFSTSQAVRKFILSKVEFFKSKSLRGKIINQFSKFGDELIGDIEDLLKDEDISVPQQRELITLLSKIGSDDAIKMTSAYIDSNSDELKAIILDALSQSQNEYALSAYLKAINDTSDKIRLKALSYLNYYSDVRILTKINNYVNERRFHNLSVEEKRQCLMIIANNTTKIKDSYLYDILKVFSKFKNKKFIETQASAAMTLGMLGDKTHSPFLKRQAKNMFSPKDLKEACKFAVEMLEKE